VTSDNSGTWKVPLHDKATAFEKNVLSNHWIKGLYPSIVEIPLDGGPVDQSTTGYSNVAHSVCWTANYLAGQAYRYAFTRDEDVRKHAEKVLRAMIRCIEVTGVKGLQARGYVLGHGESYEEREGSSNSDNWHQGKGEHANLRWRGSPSHHNYSDAIHGYAAYYDLAADENQKRMIRSAVHELVGYWAFNGGILRRVDGSVSTHILGLTDGKTPNLRTVMAAAGLKAAHHITGDGAFGEEYEKLVDQYGFRRWDAFPQRMRKRHGHDDAEHVFGHLDNLFRQEQDPELIGFYNKVLDALWENHKDDRQSLFTYIYLSLRPDDPGRSRALKEALWTLRTWPIERVFRPRMNSRRPDIGIVDGMSEKPLPMYESPWDNEYQWKGSLYKLDGWLSRCVISLAVSSEDPAVIYAIDEKGDMYRSVDGGSRWRQTGESLGRPARSISIGNRSRVLLVACDDGFHATTTAGKRWFKLPVPPEAGRPVRIVVDRSKPNVLYAVGENGVYRSLDYGERWLGAEWECLTERLPPSERRIFAVSACPCRIYGVLDGVAYTSTGNGSWTKGGFVGVPEYGGPVSTLVIDGSNPESAYVAVKVRYEKLDLNIVFRTEDGGKSWNNDLPRLYSRYVRRYERGKDVLEGELRGELHSLAARSREEILAATDEGVMRSEDGGESWKPSNHGLNIPVARGVFLPLETKTAYAGTPGGLYSSDDGGRTWSHCNLELIFRSNIPREVGSAGYLDAYWMGRYHGFITEEEATEDPANWDMDL